MVDFNRITQSFDLPVMDVLQGTESVFLDRLIIILTTAITWVPLYLVLIFIVLRNNKSLWRSTLIILFGLLAVGLASLVSDQFMKPFFMRIRPGGDMMLKYTIDIVDGYRGGGYGFVSAHAGNTMACAVFFSLVVRSRFAACVMLLWSLLNCYTRIYLGVHYPSDVLAGIVVGVVSGFVAYGIYSLVSRKYAVRPAYVSRQFTSTGYVREDIYLIAIVLLLLLIYALFRSIFEL